MHRQWVAPRHPCRRNGTPPACRTPNSIALSLGLVRSMETASRYPGLRGFWKGFPSISTMLAPVEIIDPESGKSLQARFADLQKRIPSVPDSVIGRDEISRMTSARRGREDSLHLLVMDVHKALNRVAARTAVEVIDGAHVHHLDPDDRDRVAAFMRGLNRTAPLAFGHPGLATTAARVGARLTIQNDIGATDAHVLVVHVEHGLVSVTYTDVHRVRAKFFSSLFETWNVEWSVLPNARLEASARKTFFI